MTVNSLSLECFRNYKKANVDFCKSINIINGRNAQGKTNLIEAIYYLASGRTFRTASDKELISFDSENACIRADIISSERKQNLEARIFRGRRRQFYANDVKLKNASDLSGRFTVVVFCPDDLAVVREGASVRRKLMDNTISQLRPRYVTALSEFNKLYEHKTRILKDHFEKPSLLQLLDDFNMKLAEQSAVLIYYRAAFSKSLSKRAQQIHKEFSDGQETLNIHYKTVGEIEPDDKKPKDLLVELLVNQEKYREKEIRSGICLSGAHKDDLEIEINGNAARRFASQGQARTTAISIKMAERDILSEEKGEYPVLLLDDVLSELDKKRREFLLSRIEKGQVFITCCDNEALTQQPEGKIIKIENGKVEDIS